MIHGLFSVSSGSSVILAKIVATGNARLFEGDGTYVYRLSNALMKTSDYGGTFTNIIPSDMSLVTAICSTYAGLKPNTVVLGSLAAINVMRYQPSQEITTWSSGSTLPVGFVPVDAVSDYDGNISVLTGNSHTGTESRMIISSGSPPYAMSESDSGLPTTAIITDLSLAI